MLHVVCIFVLKYFCSCLFTYLCISKVIFSCTCSVNFIEKGSMPYAVPRDNVWIFKVSFLNMCVCACVCTCVTCKWLCECSCPRGQKHLGPLEMELQLIVSPLLQMLVAKLGSSAKAVCSFNHWVTSPTSYVDFLWFCLCFIMKMAAGTLCTLSKCSNAGLSFM